MPVSLPLARRVLACRGQVHKMIFAMAELPGEFTTFDFVPGIPAPFNFGLAILLNQKMLTLAEKLQCAPALLPMLVEGQEFIDQQDELSVLQFMRKYGIETSDFHAYLIFMPDLQA